MSSRTAWWIVFLVGLAGCVYPAIDISAACLEKFPGNPDCCGEDGYLDHGTCCPIGSHAVSDVEHPEWKVCTPDEDPPADAGVCPDAGADVEADAGAP